MVSFNRSNLGMRVGCVVAALLCPLLAGAEPSAAVRLHDVRDLARFVPDEALPRLRALEREVARDPALQADFLDYYATAERRAGNLTHARLLADTLIALGRRMRDDGVLARGLVARANTQYLLEELGAAHATSFEAERLARNSGDPSALVQASIAAGESYQEEGNYPAALTKFQNAVDTARRLGPTAPELASALNALAMLYLNMGELEPAWEAENEALAVARRLASPGYAATALAGVYALASEQKSYQRARAALIEELGLERRMGARQMAVTTLVNLSDCYLREARYADAESYATQALRAATDVNSTNDISTARVNLGQALLGQGRVADGKKQFELGLATYEKQGDKPELQSVLLEYGHALERAGDYKGAIDAYNRERTITREIFAEQRQKALLELQHRYDAEKKQRQIETLRQENRAAMAELANRRLQQRVWWLLAVTFALAAAVVGMLYRKVRRANTALAEKNVQLRQQSALDPLTLLYNRRHFQEFMAGEAPAADERRAAPGDAAGGLFLLDVDHFKHINDTHGHAAGDAVLKSVAQRLRAALRETDMIVRWGGEEFLAFLPAVTPGGLDEVAHRILHAIGDEPVRYRDTQVAVTVSVGFAPFPLAPGGAPLAWEQVVNVADMALYMAKSHGRNRAYGVHRFPGFVEGTLEDIAQDLERACREGRVDLSVVPGAAHGAPGARSMQVDTKG